MKTDFETRCRELAEVALDRADGPEAIALRAPGNVVRGAVRQLVGWALGGGRREGRALEAARRLALARRAVARYRGREAADETLFQWVEGLVGRGLMARQNEGGESLALARLLEAEGREEEAGEARREAEQALEAAGDLVGQTRLQLEMHRRAVRGGDIEGAAVAADRALRLARRAAEPLEEARALLAAGDVLLWQDDARGALAAYWEAACIAEGPEGDPSLVGWALVRVGTARLALGNEETGVRQLEAALDAFRRSADGDGCAYVRGLLDEVRWAGDSTRPGRDATEACDVRWELALSAAGAS